VKTDVVCNVIPKYAVNTNSYINRENISYSRLYRHEPEWIPQVFVLYACTTAISVEFIFFLLFFLVQKFDFNSSNLLFLQVVNERLTMTENCVVCLLISITLTIPASYQWKKIVLSYVSFFIDFGISVQKFYLDWKVKH
jgi:hypothetical protein